jgi:hypothetical protein
MRCAYAASVLAVLLALSGPVCGDAPAAPPTAPPDDLSAEVQAILQRSVDDQPAETRRCISRARLTGIEILDDQRIAFVARGGNVWLNQLRRPCPGLSSGLTLEMHADGARLCRLSGVYGTDLSAISAPMASAGDIGAAGRLLQSGRRTTRCSLGDFERITPEQFLILRHALRPSATRSRKH